MPIDRKKLDIKLTPEEAERFRESAFLRAARDELGRHNPGTDGSITIGELCDELLSSGHEALGVTQEILDAVVQNHEYEDAIPLIKGLDALRDRRLSTRELEKKYKQLIKEKARGFARSYIKDVIKALPRRKDALHDITVEVDGLEFRFQKGTVLDYRSRFEEGRMERVDIPITYISHRINPDNANTQVKLVTYGRFIRRGYLELPSSSSRLVEFDNLPFHGSSNGIKKFNRFIESLMTYSIEDMDGSNRKQDSDQLLQIISYFPKALVKATDVALEQGDRNYRLLEGKIEAANRFK